MKFFKIIFTLLYSLAFSLTFAQERTDIIKSFDIENKGKYIKASCVIKSGNTCNGIKLYRSTDTINFSIIGIIPGICGFDDNESYYEFNDTLPVVNDTAYYKMEFGGSGFTETIAIEFLNLNNQSIQIWPNPINDISRIVTLNKDFKDFEYEIFSMSGEKLEKGNGRGDRFIINSDVYADGMYYLKIVNIKDSEVFQTKFLVRKN